MMMRIRGSLVLLVLVCAAAETVLARAAPPKARPAQSQTCRRCHEDIHAMWRESAHARSLDGDVFLDALDETVQRSGDSAGRLCLRCHAPLAEVIGDRKLEQKVSWDGVSCEVCHSITAVDVSGQTPRNELDVGPVKRGPIRDAVPGGHEVAWSRLHTESLVCAGCHEYVNPEGVPLISTWSEWKTSAAARAGRTCQTCHMSLVQTSAADARAARSSRSGVNLHQTPGGHSLEQLHKALAVTLRMQREGDALVVEVDLNNRGAGHAVPTGMPGRKVILVLGVRSTDERSFEERREYSRIFNSAAGARITRDSEHFIAGVRPGSDTRIKPDEVRKERFRFAVPAAATAFVDIHLHYEHAPFGGKEGRTWITFYSEQRTMRPHAAHGG